VEVFRAGQSLGNLYDIRQAFHLYQDQVEIWAVKTNQLHLVPPPRRKQPPHNSNMVYENGVLMRREDDGSLAPADDQLMFRTHIQMARRGSSS